MRKDDIRFVVGEPVVFIPSEKIVAIADIQIGLEHELYRMGVVIHAQVEGFIKRLDKIIRDTKAKKLVVVGDLKHMVPGISLREERQLMKFFEHLLKKVEIILVKGNHDTGLETLVPSGVKICGSEGVRIGRFGFFHGHAWPAKDLLECDYLLMGHLQPAIEFKDYIGYRHLEQVWVRGKLEKKMIKEKYKVDKTGDLNIVIIPAFNRLLGSAIINNMELEDYMGPLIPSGFLNLDSSEIFLLDGTLIGKLKGLKKSKLFKYKL